MALGFKLPPYFDALQHDSAPKSDNILPVLSKEPKLRSCGEHAVSLD